MGNVGVVYGGHSYCVAARFRSGHSIPLVDRRACECAFCRGVFSTPSRWLGISSEKLRVVPGGNVRDDRVRSGVRRGSSYSEMQRVETFAATNHVAVDRIGALPIPPSLLDWGDAIRTPDGVYLSQFDLRQSEPAPFRFLPDSPPDAFTRRALEEPDVQLYLTFARFPSIQTSVENGEHLVEFSEDRCFRTGDAVRAARLHIWSFSMPRATCSEQGFQTNAMSLREIERTPPKSPGASP